MNDMTPQADRNEVDQLLHWMPIIIMRARGINDWTRQFCVSVAGRMKRGPVNPSAKQIAVMRKIVDEFQAANMRGDDLVEGQTK